MTRARRWLPAVAVLCGLAALPVRARSLGADSLPTALSDQEFWRLVTTLSEPNGFFRSENLVSNEHTYEYVVPALRKAVAPGGVYLGVAPDQNFTYIVAAQPRFVFIVDIRRGNLLEHLMYKAILELAADRAEFVSILFSKPRPPGLTATSTVDQIFDAFDRVSTSEPLYRRDVERLHDVLVKEHGFALSADDLEQLDSIYFAFFWDGPDLRYTSLPAMPTGGRPGVPGGGFAFANSGFPTYEDLARATDATGEAQGYLASEANFKFLKTLERENRLVPVVGDFAGPKALRAVGAYVRAHGAVVTAFYVSNVEQYLFQDGVFPAFARNVATLPVDATSTFIRSVSARYGYGGGLLGPDGRASALDPIGAFVRDFEAGRLQTYYDVNVRSK